MLPVSACRYKTDSGMVTRSFNPAFCLELTPRSSGGAPPSPSGSRSGRPVGHRAGLAAPPIGYQRSRAHGVVIDLCICRISMCDAPCRSHSSHSKPVHTCNRFLTIFYTAPPWAYSFPAPGTGAPRDCSDPLDILIPPFR